MTKNKNAQRYRYFLINKFLFPFSSICLIDKKNALKIYTDFQSITENELQFFNQNLHIKDIAIRMPNIYYFTNIFSNNIFFTNPIVSAFCNIVLTASSPLLPKCRVNSFTYKLICCCLTVSDISWAY